MNIMNLCEAWSLPEQPAPYEVEVDDETVVGLANRDLGYADPAQPSKIAPDLPLDGYAAQSGRSPDPMIIHLADEVAQLREALNLTLAPRHPLIPPDMAHLECREIPRDTVTLIIPNRLELPVNLCAFSATSRARRIKMLWTLLRVAGCGPRESGSMRAPLRFGLVAETHGFDELGPIWSNHRLVISCDEDDYVPDIRTQVDLLSRHIFDPANVLPLNAPSMMIRYPETPRRSTLWRRAHQ